MYNRYIPQSDGSHRRNPIRSEQPQNYSPPLPPPRTTPPEPKCVQDEHPASSAQPCSPASLPTLHKNESASSFLRGLLPRDLDTGDLLIIVLLLLLAGDSKEDKSTALLTLALYLFM